MKKVLLAMVLLEQFATIQETCQDGRLCSECPFKDGLACTAVTTRKVIEVVGDVFREYLYTSGHYPMGDADIEDSIKDWSDSEAIGINDKARREGDLT